MPGWSIFALPTGFVAQHIVTFAPDGSASETYVVHGYGKTSKPLVPDPPAAGVSAQATQFQTDLDAFVDGNLPASYGAANKRSLLHQRNRWLAQTDPYVLPHASLPADMPIGVLAVVADKANQDALRTWRQALRDYPASVADWSQPPSLPNPPPILLPSGRPLILIT